MPSQRSWDQGHETELDACLNRVDVHFEFCRLLGIEYYCFHDRDVSPEGATVAETEQMFDVVADKLLAKQKEAGMKLLWGTSNLFSHKRFMHGGPTNPEMGAVCMAAAQVKKCLDVTKKLGGENFVMWGGRDGYQSLLNTDYAKEQQNYANFLTATYQVRRREAGSYQLPVQPETRPTYDHHRYRWYRNRYRSRYRWSVPAPAPAPGPGPSGTVPGPVPVPVDRYRW